MPDRSDSLLEGSSPEIREFFPGNKFIYQPMFFLRSHGDFSFFKRFCRSPRRKRSKRDSIAFSVIPVCELNSRTLLPSMYLLSISARSAGSNSLKEASRLSLSGSSASGIDSDAPFLLQSANRFSNAQYRCCLRPASRAALRATTFNQHQNASSVW